MNMVLAPCTHRAFPPAPAEAMHALQPRHNGHPNLLEPPEFVLAGGGVEREGNRSSWESYDLGCGFPEGREFAILLVVCARLFADPFLYHRKAPLKCLCDISPLLVNSFLDVNNLGGTTDL